MSAAGPGREDRSDEEGTAVKIVVYWEDSGEESSAKRAARYLLSLFRKRGMPKAEILVRSIGAGLADEAQRLADQMEAAFGERNDYMSTYEDEVRVLAAQAQIPGIVFADPLQDRSGWTLADVYAMRSAPNPVLPQGGMGVLPKGDPGPVPRSAQDAVYLGGQLSSAQLYGVISQADSPDKLKAALELNGFHDVGTIGKDGVR